MSISASTKPWLGQTFSEAVWAIPGAAYDFVPGLDGLVGREVGFDIHVRGWAGWVCANFRGSGAFVVDDDFLARLVG